MYQRRFSLSLNDVQYLLHGSHKTIKRIPQTLLTASTNDRFFCQMAYSAGETKCTTNVEVGKDCHQKDQKWWDSFNPPFQPFILYTIGCLPGISSWATCCRWILQKDKNLRYIFWNEGSPLDEYFTMEGCGLYVLENIQVISMQELWQTRIE